MTQPPENWTATRNRTIARAPVRVSFGGGGTDLSVYYEKHGGFVLSTTIDRYCHVFARPARDGGIHINSADYRVWQTFRRGQIPEVTDPLRLPKAVLEWFLHHNLLPNGVELFLASEVGGGTGLGSSSAMTVALIQALAALARTSGSDLSLNVKELAELACHVEIERLQMPIGKQDQYASAFGGLNTITFDTSGGVTVDPLPISPRLRHALQMRLMLFSTGRTHDSADILRRQRSNTEKEPLVLERLHRLKALGQQMCDALAGHDLDRFGHLLHESWQAKKQLTDKISNSAIDQWYEAARKAGALGGKISGAGGGGFLLLYCPLNRQRAVRQQLSSLGLREMPFAFTKTGATTSPTHPTSPPSNHPTTQPSNHPTTQPPIIATYWQQLTAINRQMPLQAIAQAAELLYDCRRRQGTVYVAGHGGSASTASHFACDLTRGALSNGAAFRVVALAENIHFTTALAEGPSQASDYGANAYAANAYDQLFAGQLATQIQPEDLLVAITSRGDWGQEAGSTGASAILAAAETARGADATIIALTGPNPGRLQQIADVTICVPAPTTPQLQAEQVEDAHLAVAHTLCLALQARAQHSTPSTSRIDRVPEAVGS